MSDTPHGDYTALADDIQMLTTLAGQQQEELDSYAGALKTLRRANNPQRTSRQPRTGYRRTLAGRRHGRARWWLPEAAGCVHHDVVAFIDQLRATHQIRHLPPHWDSDPALLAEAVALRAAWQKAYNGAEPDPLGPTRFLEAVQGFAARTGHHVRRQLATQFAAGGHRDVVAFGEHIRTTYALDHLPADWHTDRALYEETTALYLDWLATFAAPTGAPDQTTRWHEAREHYAARTEQYLARRGGARAAAQVDHIPLPPPRT